MNNIQFDQEIYKRISPREIEVAKAASRGMGQKGTGEVLGITKNTVQNHRRSLLRKLGCKNITEVVTTLKDAGII